MAANYFVKYHLQNAKNHGVTKEEAAAIITNTGFYAGWPKAWAAFNLAKEVWNEPTTAVSEKDKYVSTIMFPIGEPNNAYAKYFIGQSYLAPISTSQVKMFNVTFEPKCINIPANVKHWHGAAPDSWFSHIAVEIDGTETSNEWLEPVTDDVYNKLK